MAARDDDSAPHAAHIAYAGIQHARRCRAAAGRRARCSRHKMRALAPAAAASRSRVTTTAVQRRLPDFLRRSGRNTARAFSREHRLIFGRITLHATRCFLIISSGARCAAAASPFHYFLDASMTRRTHIAFSARNDSLDAKPHAPTRNAGLHAYCLSSFMIHSVIRLATPRLIRPCGCCRRHFWDDAFQRTRPRLTHKHATKLPGDFDRDTADMPWFQRHISPRLCSHCQRVMRFRTFRFHREVTN